MIQDWRVFACATALVTGFAGPAFADHVTPKIQQMVSFAAETGTTVSLGQEGETKKGSPTAIGVRNANGHYRLIFVPGGSPGPLFPQERLRQFGRDTAKNGTDVTVGTQRNDGNDRLATFSAVGQEIFAVADSLDIENFVPVVRRAGVDVVGIDPFSETTHVVIERLRLDPSEFHGQLSARVSSSSGAFALDGPNGKTLPFSVKVAAADACGAERTTQNGKVGLSLNGESTVDLCFRLDPTGTAVPGGRYVSILSLKLSDR